MYASTPFFLLGWIPYIAAIGVIWYLVLLILGLAEMQDMSVGEAAMAVVVPLLLLLIGAIIWGGVIYTLTMGILGIFTKGIPKKESNQDMISPHIEKIQAGITLS